MLLSLLKLAWPFIKEMILGRNSLRYALRKNRVRLAFFLAVILSFVLNWVTIPRLFTISNNYIVMEREFKATRETLETYKDDKDAIDQTKAEVLALRAKVKELEDAAGKACPETKTQSCPEAKPLICPEIKQTPDSIHHDIKQIKSRLSSSGS